ncbi:MAG TPA: PASTA domain-containing protein [Solirubrobacterales bacterium]
MALLGLLLATLFAARAEARVEGFQGLASSPVELTAFTADATTGLIYGQENEGTAYFRYDPRTNAWNELAPAPIDSGNNGGATYLGGKIYTAYTNNDSELGVYDIASNSWTIIDNPLNDGTTDIAAGHGKLYLAWAQEFFAIDPATGIASSLAAPPQFLPAKEDENCDEGFESWGGLQVVEGKIYGHQGNGCAGFAVYDIASNSWQELPLVPKTLAPGETETEGPVAGSAYNPLTNTYLTYGPYGGESLLRFDIEAGAWSTSTLPFIVGDGAMAYVSLPGIEGVYIIQGEEGTRFTRYTERNVADLSTKLSSKVAKGGKITLSIQVTNNGPERAGGVVLSNPLPKGAKLLSAVASQGTCNPAPALACNLGVLRSGTSAKVTIKVKARSRKVTSTATVTSFAFDSNAGSAKVTTKQCVVPKLRNRALKGAKKALRKANCKPKVVQRYSSKVDAGKVIRSKSRSKFLPAGRKVKLIVSLGPKQTN